MSQYELRYQFLAVFAERICMTLVIILQAWVFFIVPTDNNGDPNDYISIAKGLLSTETPILFNRFIGYPIIIKILSFNFLDLNLLFLFQSIVFVSALFYFAKSFSLPPHLRCLLYLPGLIPSIAYIQKLIFPDGIILSLLLIFVTQLRRQKLFVGILVSLILILIKMIFIFLPVLLLASWLSETKRLSSTKSYAAFIIFVLCLIPAVFLIKPFPLYQTFVQIPDFMNKESDFAYLPEKLNLACGGSEATITDPTILSSVTRHTCDEYYMPLGKKIADELGCTREDMRKLQRQIIINSFTEAPLHRVKNIFLNFMRAVYVFPQNNHVDYMLYQKYRLFKTHFNWLSLYEDSQLKSFRSHGFSPLKQPGFVLLEFSVYNNKSMIRLLAQLFGVFTPLVLWRLCNNRAFYTEVGIFLVFVVVYSFLVSLFAFIYDRYVYINFFMWMLMIATIAKGAKDTATSGTRQQVVV